MKREKREREGTFLCFICTCTCIVFKLANKKLVFCTSSKKRKKIIWIWKLFEYNEWRRNNLSCINIYWIELTILYSCNTQTITMLILMLLIMFFVWRWWWWWWFSCLIYRKIYTYVYIKLIWQYSLYYYEAHKQASIKAAQLLK